jgi:hypothetical protein
MMFEWIRKKLPVIGSLSAFGANRAQKMMLDVIENVEQGLMLLETTAAHIEMLFNRGQ